MVSGVLLDPVADGLVLLDYIFQPMFNKVKIPKNTLYQYIEKEHIDDEISNEKWKRFVEQNQDQFAEECSEIAQRLYDFWDATLE